MHFRKSIIKNSWGNIQKQNAPRLVASIHGFKERHRASCMNSLPVVVLHTNLLGAAPNPLEAASPLANLTLFPYSSTISLRRNDPSGRGFLRFSLSRFNLINLLNSENPSKARLME
ncbi:hypothetical protein Y032_0399g740 [Ancylostoma ceylanicum]|uniref:Uncharacterized protein n=1 Tax=Ancylostoma ceylanicum TaxID=53326 RepID=A0A016RQX5_9BILA|nr:hypothetical protein Y032_0399g740 [Ancylostoma ceylanicum]